MEAAGGSDFNCDFNAPMFVDFTTLDNENDHADAEAYFDVSTCRLCIVYLKKTLDLLKLNSASRTYVLCTTSRKYIAS